MESLADDELRVEVSGSAVLLGLASANPSPLLPYTGDRVQTHRGSALAVILVEGDGGTVGDGGGGTLRVTSDRHRETRIAF